MNTKQWIAVIIGFIMTAVMSCATSKELVPAPTANKVSGERGVGAAIIESGVRVEARMQAWYGFPSQLDAVTPVLVTVKNNSNVPLRIRYNEFTLRGMEWKLAALPPFDIKATEVKPMRYAFPHSNFMVAPNYTNYWTPSFNRWGGTWSTAPGYYNNNYAEFRRLQLPTGDMVQKALPEGVLNVGGQITGFLYFKKIPDDAQRATFTLDLVNAKTEVSFGQATIPFVVE